MGQEDPTKPACAHERHAHPRRLCNVVLKGGITSGVVYPGAIAALAERYAFQSIGGTSAGAIAAAATAAAEYRRRHGDGSAFARLDQLPQWLARDGKIAGLFQAEPAGRPILDPVLAALKESNLEQRALALVDGAVRNARLATLAGAAPGLVFLTSLAAAGAAVPWWVLATGLPMGMAATIVGGLLGAGARALVSAIDFLPNNGFGLCSGRTQDANQAGLTDWLADLIAELADKRDGEPLTFRDLWQAPWPDFARDIPPPRSERSIDLQMLTANLTHTRPYRLPFRAREDFLFRSEDLATLFPKSVSEWIERRGRKKRLRVDATSDHTAEFLALEDPGDLPVVVAARMSLSFPLLLSAVPLYAVDYSRRVNQQARKGKRKSRSSQPPVAERCWFSDGGLCSNFPIHLFDEPIPRWPTFGFNLCGFHPDHEPKPETAESEKLYLPQMNRGGRLEAWNRFDARTGRLARLAGFLGALGRTSQNWLDDAQMRVPGFRDRIVHISHATHEGGLNLFMPPAVVDRLARRGRHAGERLRATFAGTGSGDDATPAWENHRWVRLRSSLAMIERLLANFRFGLENPAPGDRPLLELITRKKGEPPKDYHWRDEQHADFALGATADLLHWARLDGPGRNLSDKAPRPEPELRIMPPL